MKSPGKIDWSAVRAQLAEGERRLDEVLNPAPEAIERVLQRRAAALRTRHTATEEKTSPLLLATAGAECFAVPLSAVTEIVKIGTITPVPGAPILGIIAIRGEFFSLIAPAGGAPPAEEQSPKWAVVLRHAQHQVALAFTRIETIAAVPESAVAEQTAGAVIQVGAELATLLDSAAILQRLEGTHR